LKPHLQSRMKSSQYSRLIVTLYTLFAGALGAGL